MKKLKEGFTTGSCAAACALASCLWQRDGECPTRVQIVVPEGRTYAPAILERSNYTCGVIKDSGDDPDITKGCEVQVQVALHKEDGAIRFLAGEGIGTITLPGLKLLVGEPAINPVPRQMIEEAVRAVYPTQAAAVTVSIIGGAELAAKTFNPRLGVVGGLSVLGTTGIVRPMSEEALTESIYLEMSMHHAQGHDRIALVFGSQGEQALKEIYPQMSCVQVSNFVGFALDGAAELGFTSLLLAGQAGKLVKVAGGSMQTHSRYGDGRRETLIAHLALKGAPISLLMEIENGVTLDGAIQPIIAAGYQEVFDRLCHAASDYCMARVYQAVCVDTMILDGKGAILGQWEGQYAK
ncbi:MAG: cobalamin biosynthesis protein CbiD [Clostridiales bacterium]|nr:cobalamin biosynthesis protein CbiD [Clostridiales bacterium]